MQEYVVLVQKAIHGSAEERRASFDQLIHLFQKMAYKQAYQTLNDRGMAEDAVQEAFLAAYLQIQNLREPEAFPMWLRRIVMTQCDRLIRGKSLITEPLETRFDLAADAPQPESLIVEQEIREHLRSAIDALPEHERAVTEGFYMQGQSQKELAELLHIPVTTVKKRLQYAREHLRLLVGDLNTAFDQAIASVLKPPKPQKQPVYVYTRHDRPESEEE